MARKPGAGKKSSPGITPATGGPRSRHFVARGHRSATPIAGARLLALLPRPPLAPYRIGVPVAVRTHHSSWQPTPTVPRPKSAKRGTPEWRAKVSAGTRAGIQSKAPARAPRGRGRPAGFVVSQATKDKLRAGALRRYAAARANDVDARGK